MTPVIHATGLVKRYGRVDALAGLDLIVDAGHVVALLGPNGAGTTTFVRSVATLVRPDEGDLRVCGYDVVRDAHRVRTLIGLAGQHAAVEAAMTGRENLEMVGRLYGSGRRDARVRAGEVIDRLSLGDVADRLTRTYSGGQRRRLDLGASLVGAPRLLLLDEPSTGLDPRSRNELWDAIRALAERGTQVVLTTQYLDEADHLAGRIVIIDQGRVIADGTPSDLKTRAGRDVIEVHLRDAGDLALASGALRGVAGEEPLIDPGTRRISLPGPAGADQLVAVARALTDAGVLAEDISQRRPTLDEVFLELTGKGLEPHDHERQSA